MARFKFVVSEHGKPIVKAYSERAGKGKEKFDRRFAEKYGDDNNVGKTEKR